MTIRNKLDGGWGWIIVLGSAVVNCIFGGYIRGFGIFFSAFQSSFGGTASQTSLVNGMRGVVGTIMCIFSIGLIKRFSERVVVMVAGSFVSLSFILCVFANSMTYVIFVNGILSGIGTAILALASQLIVGKYFDKRKSLAITLAFAGSGVGQIALPPLIVYWLQEYGVRGMMLLFGGITLHFFVVAALYTPFEKFQTRKQSPKQFQANAEIAEGEFENKTELVIQPVDSSQYNQKFEDKNILIETTNGTHVEWLPTAEGSIRHHENGGSSFIERFPLLESEADALRQIPEIAKDNEEDQYSVSNEAGLIEHENVWFLSDSVGSVYVTNEELYRFRQKTREISQKDDNDTGRIPLCAKLLLFLQDTFVISIFKNVRFSLFFITTGLGFGSFVSQSIFLIPRALEQGVLIEQAAFLLSIAGGVDIIGRIVMGLIADINWIGPIIVLIGYSVAMAVANLLLPFCESFPTLAVYAAAFGFFGSAAHVLGVPILLTISSRDLLLQSLGMATIAQSTAYAILPVFMGLIRDSSVTCASVFYACAGIQMTLVVLMCAVLFVNKRVRATQKSERTELTVD